MSIKIPAYLAKRIDRAGGQQSKDGPCLLCRGPFRECSHSRVQVDAVLDEHHRQRVVLAALKEVR